MTEMPTIIRSGNNYVRPKAGSVASLKETHLDICRGCAEKKSKIAFRLYSLYQSGCCGLTFFWVFKFLFYVLFKLSTRRTFQRFKFTLRSFSKLLIYYDVMSFDLSSVLEKLYRILI